MALARSFTDLLRAEWIKLTANRLLASFTVWVYPVGAATFLMVMGPLLGLMEGPTPFVSGRWPEAMLGVWGILLSFPGHIMARLPVIAFMAMAFAGEYEWNTWKNVVPRTRRAALLIAKFIILGVLICASLALTSLLWGGGRAIIAAVYGWDFGPAIDADVAGDFAVRFLVEAALAFAMLLILGAFTAISVLLTRSIVGGILLGFGFSILEGLSGLLFPMIATLFDRLEWINGYAYTPDYAVHNIRSWVVRGELFRPAPMFAPEPTLLASVLVLAVWAAALIAITVWLFERQDLTS